MQIAFYIAGFTAIAATIMTVTRTNPVHALLYLILSLLAVAVAFFTMGAPFVAALEVIIYAGAIMVLFIFVVMMLNLGERARAQERQWQPGRAWIGPVILASVLLIELAYLVLRNGTQASGTQIAPKQVAIVLFGPYLVGIELASILLLAGMVGAYHLGTRQPQIVEIQHGTDTDERRVVARDDLVHAGADRIDRAP